MKLFHILLPKCALIFFLCISFVQESKAQLTAGDIMFVGFNADGNDGFAFVALAAIPAGTTIYFTDNNWDGATFGTGEGIITWTTAAAIPAGNVIILTNTSAAPVASTMGTATLTGSVNLAATNESLYAFLGTSGTAPTTFLSAISNNVFAAPNTLIGTGLVAGVNALAATGNDDVLVYIGGPPCTVSIALCAAMIANFANWATDDGAGNQDTDGVFPDFPSSVLLAPAVSVLPVELISFTAFVDESGFVILNWLTASELNNDFFEIERATDPDNWMVIGRIKGEGNSNQVKGYAFMDESLRMEQTYYRLSQTDFDGEKEYFNIVSVQTKAKKGSIKLFPNPTTDVLYVQGNGVSLEEIVVLDAIGRDITVRVIADRLNDQYTRLTIGNLEKGKYIIIVDGESSSFVVF